MHAANAPTASDATDAQTRAESSPWVAREMGEPGLAEPSSILDLLNYQLHLLLSFSTAEVTRMCEQQFGITRHVWGYIGLLAAFGPLALYAQMFPKVLAIHHALLQPLTAGEVQMLGRALAKLRPQAVALKPAGSLQRKGGSTEK